MSTLYQALNEDFYGAEVILDPVVAIEWARIPHFYYGYYVYQYATGISARRRFVEADSGRRSACGRPLPRISARRRFGYKHQPSARRGVDMATPQPVHQALDVFDSVIAQMEELAE
jgi:oligoendopeptidase F